MPIFYFNVGKNCCANESWVVEYLYKMEFAVALMKQLTN